MAHLEGLDVYLLDENAFLNLLEGHKVDCLGSLGT